VESAAQLQERESEVHPDDASQSPPSLPGLAQLAGGAQEQSPGTAQLTGAQEAQHSSADDGEEFSCKRCVKNKVFTRPQDLLRHNREVHGDADLDMEVHELDLPRKCPFCPPDRRPRKRHSLMKKHLIDDHHDGFAEDDLNHIRSLKGREVFEFVDTISPPQSTPH
jgi:hypothetical protein